MHIEPVDEFMNSDALLTNGVKEGAWVSGQNFPDGGVSQHGMKTANAGGEIFGRAAGSGALDGFNRAANAINRVSNGMWEVAIE